MRRLRMAGIGVMAAGALTWQVNVAVAQTSEPIKTVQSAAAAVEKAVTPPGHDWRPIVVGLGAIAGVVVFNVTALGWEAIPGGLAYAPGATVPAEMSVAMSRVYATTAAVIGGWIGYYASAR